jgi:sugar lactone lactonase YvrE
MEVPEAFLYFVYPDRWRLLMRVSPLLRCNRYGDTGYASYDIFLGVHNFFHGSEGPMLNRLLEVACIAAAPRTRIFTLFAVAAMAAAFASAADRSEIVVNDTRAFPESMTVTADGTVYFGSLSKGMVYRAPPGSGSAEPWIKAGTAGLKNVLGVFANEKSHTLWVCSTAIPGVSTGETSLKSFELRTGEFQHSYTFPDGKGICNDVAVAPDGTIYVTETSQGRILRLPRGAAALEVWCADPLLASADGIALLADGSVYVNGVATGVLARVPVRADGSAGAAVKLETSRPLDHPDGMRTVGTRTMLLAEGAGRLDEVTIDGDKAQIRVLKDNLAGGPTAVALIGDVAFVLEAKLKYFNDPSLKDQDPGKFRALAVPYRAPR